MGGGINEVADFERVLQCGADKVSVNSGAIRNPNLIEEAAKRYGDQCVVLSVDAKRVDGKYTVFAKGGRESTGMDALEWIRFGVDHGAGEIVLNSIDTDGVKGGFDLKCSEPSVRLFQCLSSPPAARAKPRILSPCLKRSPRWTPDWPRQFSTLER